MVRLELHPLLTPPAEAVLSTYYQQQRQAADRSAARTTIRMLESAIRLSQAHARLCFRSSVVVLDACVAISLLEGLARSACPDILSFANRPHTLSAAASEKQTQMGGGGHAMHGHVSANVLRQQAAGVADSQGGLADPSEAAGETRC
jgi:DNA replicative helicase MCM subunit Mcm2 (Cdc46/Mcm family)